MTYLTFDVGVMMGKCDGCNISIEYDVSDEEYEALKKAEEDGTYFDDLENNPILDKLYSNLYDQAADEVDESEEYYEDEYDEDHVSEFDIEELEEEINSFNEEIEGLKKNLLEEQNNEEDDELYDKEKYIKELQNEIKELEEERNDLLSDLEEKKEKLKEQEEDESRFSDKFSITIHFPDLDLEDEDD